MLTNFNFGQTFGDSVTKADSMLTHVTNFFYQTENIQYPNGWCSYAASNIFGPMLANSDLDHVGGNLGTAWYEVRSDLSSLNQDEKDIIDDLYAVLNSDFTGLTATQISDQIVSDVDDLIYEYNGITWSENQGDLAGGLLYIAKSSAQYWGDHADDYDLPDPSFFIVGDCYGYLSAWTWAWLIEEDPDPNSRMKKGLGGAVIGSGAKLIGA